MTNNGESPYIVNLTEKHLKTNSLMKSVISKDFLVDVSGLLCGNSSTCLNTTAEGLIISIDGNHLTKEGAAHLGEQLKIVL